jgi:adenylate cyclase
MPWPPATWFTRGWHDARVSTADPGEPVHSEAAAYTADQVAASAGMELEQAKRIWRALGFPEAGDEAIFTGDDIVALRQLTSMITGDIVDFDLAVNLARGVGQTMARLSDWQVSAMLHRVEEVTGQGGDNLDLIARTLGATDDFVDQFEDLLVFVWRRHLQAAVARVAASLSGDIGTTQLSVGFADIVSFTALSNTLTEEKIGDLVERFESRCADVVAVNRGRVIKSMGDAVLFVNDDPIGAYDTAEGIINVIGRDPRMPDVRVGLASGLVVTRLGDVFGPPVNMAARLTAVARRNRIITDESTAALLPEDQFETRRLPARPVRGFGIVEPVAVRRH